MVGYNLRWHPLLQEMRNVITKGAIGKPVSMHVEIGENIADWHPWEEYQYTYAAHHSGGGGATLCFSHDIDYLYWFFGYPKNSRCRWASNTSPWRRRRYGKDLI
jgi:predicted dehydrogenase